MKIRFSLLMSLVVAPIGFLAVPPIPLVEPDLSYAGPTIW